MIDIIKGWFEKHFSDPQAIILISILVLGGILVLYWGHILTPVLAGIVIAYVLEGLVKKITHLGVPRFISFLISYTLFITALALILFGLVPLVLPIGIANPVERLYAVRERMRALKGSYQPLLAFGILALTGLFIKPVQDFVLGLFAKKTTAVMTNVPGPRQSLYLAGALRSHPT